MVQLIDELEFGPEQLENGLIAWDINGKKYRNEVFLMVTNAMMCWSIGKRS